MGIVLEPEHSSQFAKDMSAPEKQSLLEQMGIAMREETKEEVNEMCNLGEGIYEQGIEKGIKQGASLQKEKGIQALVETCRELGAAPGVIEDKLVSKYTMSHKEAKQYVERFLSCAVA